jgi:hypothetical protein
MTPENAALDTGFVVNSQNALQASQKASSLKPGLTITWPTSNVVGDDTIPKDLPTGNAVGSMLFWNGTAWQTLAPPTGSATYVLGCAGGTLRWVETEAC